MHFYSYEDRSLGYPRKIEKIFRIVNKALWAVQLSLVMIGIVLLVLATDDMFTESPLSAGARLSLSEKFTTVFDNCSSTSTTDTFLLKSVPFTVDDGNVRFLLGLYSSKVIAVIVIAAFSVAVSLFNRILYDLNVFFFRVEFLIIRKDIIATADVILLCGSIAANSIAHDFAAPLRHHVAHCTAAYNSGATLSYSPLVAIATGGSRSYLAPENFIPMYLAACISLLLYVAEFVLLIKFTLVDSEVAAPPEGGQDEKSVDENGDAKQEPMADPTKEMPPQSTLDRRKEERILEQQRKKATEETVAGGNQGNNSKPPLFAIQQNSNYTGVVDSPTRNNTNNNNNAVVPSSVNNNNNNNAKQSQQKIRGGFAAMRAAAAFRAASRAHSATTAGGTNGENTVSTSPATQPPMNNANTGAMFSDPVRRSSYAGASITPQNQ